MRLGFNYWLLFALHSACSLAGAPTITGPQTIEWNGVSYRVADDRGVYFFDPIAFHAVRPGAPFPEVNRALSDHYGPRATIEPVLLELTDYIDCSGTSHGFSHGPACDNPNRSSRLITVGGRTFRVTGELYDNFTINFFSYDFATSQRAGEPHLLIAESLNDRERYTSITINALSKERAGLGWAPPYDNEPDINPWGDPWWQYNGTRTQQGPVFEPDVGLTTYTGREFPVNNQRFNVYVLFFSKSKTMRVVVDSQRMTEQFSSNDGAAVSRMWIFRIATPLAKPAIERPAAERKLGLYYPHSWYLYAHQGTPVRTLAHRQANHHRLCQYLLHSGINWLEFNAINGADRTDHSWYTGGRHFPSTPAGDLLAELPPVAAQYGIDLLPVITSLKEPRNFQGIVWNNSSYQMNTNGAFTRAFGNALPDPLRPEVQQVMFNLIDEVASRVAAATSVKGIGVRVNGKIGLCYAAHEDGQRGARLSGYSAWNLQEFKNNTGSGVPTSPPGTAYNWLVARPAEYTAWINWRCARMRQFWLAMRDRVRTHRPDLILYIKCVLPSEVPGTNIEWPGTAPEQLLHEAGYDPSLYVHDEGIVIQRGMMVAEDRYYSRARWNEPFGANHARYKTFHYAAGLPERYVTRAGRACELYHNYVESTGHPFNEFGHPCGLSGFRTMTPAAFGRNFFEPIIMSVRRQEVDTLTLMGWNRASLGNEHALRRFAQAYRALPTVPAAPFPGTVSPAEETIWVRMFGDVIAVVNDHANARTVTLTFSQPVAPGEELYDVGEGHVYIGAESSNRTQVTLSMEPWSLRALRAALASGAPSPTPTPTSTATATPTATRTPTPTRTTGPDSDQDGIPDELEGFPAEDHQTNRFLNDSDGDGLSDGSEDANRNGARDPGETNPRDRDSDDDGHEDGQEVLIWRTDPLDNSAPPPLADSDRDRLPAALDPNDTSPDTDGDRYLDSYEAVTGGLASVADAQLRPRLGDASADGVITNVDALVLQSIFLGLSPAVQFAPSNGDLNRDGQLTNIDALLVQSFFLGMSQPGVIPLW